MDPRTRPESCFDLLLRRLQSREPAQAERLADRQLAACAALGIAILAPEELPTRFRALRDYPVLFARGFIDALTARAEGIVGARAATSGAVACAARVARHLVESGRVVVSGGARGVDAAAHQEAMKAGGRTFVYLGVAIDRIYPAEHRALFAQVIDNGGALLSEHAPGEATYPFHHARRNRLIAAHAERLWVIEAGHRSGSLGTARWAFRLERSVLVPPVGTNMERGGIDSIIEKGWGRPWRQDASGAIQ